ncbi:MAG: methyl-accepting chemotaxis protein [bacterium]
MRKANRILTLFYSINLFISTSIYSALLSTTSTIRIQEHLLNIILIFILTALDSVIFLMANPIFLQKVKYLLNETYDPSSEKKLGDLITYPFKIIPLVIITELIAFISYPVIGVYTNIITTHIHWSSIAGFIISALFVLMISTILHIYSTKIVTNSYLSKIIKKLDIIEVKSIFLPIKYKIIGVFTIITVLAFLVVVYAIVNNGAKFADENLYNNIIKSASILSRTLTNSPSADDVLKEFTNTFKKEYNFYLYNINNKNIITYSDAHLSDKILDNIKNKSEITDKQNDQTLFILASPITINNEKFLVVVGVRNKIYKTTLNNFISTMFIIGIFILFTVISTTFLISDELSSHMKQLLNHSIAISEKNLKKLPTVVSTDEFGIASLNLRKLSKNFKESKVHMDTNISSMINAINSIKNNISGIRAIISEQASYTDNLLNITNSIQDISKQITDISLPFRNNVDENSENINLAIQKNKEIKSFIGVFSNRITRILKLIEKDINVYEDIRYTLTKLKNMLLSVNTNYNTLKTQISTTNKQLTEYSGFVTEIKSLNSKNTELIKDIEIITNETQTMIDKLLTFLSTFLSHIIQADDMLGIINNVAERTNLLSVNAFILAASPQIEGRNFRVMAEEIKKLAERARSGSTDISNYITKVKRNINDITILMQNVNVMISTLKQSISSINSFNNKIENSINSILDTTSAIIEENKKQLTSDNLSNILSDESLSSIIDNLTERFSIAIEDTRKIVSVFGEIKNHFLNLTELINTNENLLIPLNNAIENIKAFISYINDSVSIDIKEQILTSLNSTEELIKQIKESEQSLIDLESVIIQLLQELDLLKENVNLFVG